MSFLINIMGTKIIAALEQQLVIHAPDIQQAVWAEAANLLSGLFTVIKQKIDVLEAQKQALLQPVVPASEPAQPQPQPQPEVQNAAQEG